jgi:DNA polymerase II small subunit
MMSEVELLRKFLRRGLNLTPEALSCLMRVDDVERIVELLPRKPVIDYEDILPLMRAESDEKIEFDVILKPDNLGISGNVEEFIRFIRARFDKLRPLVARWVDLEPIPIAELRNKTSRNGDNLFIIGMIMEKISAKDGSIRMVIEDESGTVNVVFRRDSRAWELAERTPLDSVIGVRGTYVNGKLYGESILLPDVKSDEVPEGRHEGRAVMISDAHVGSRYFNEWAFEKFVRWLRSEDARDVRYLIICGDLVDGIGVYPNQEEELRISDVYKQFEYAGRFLSRIPSGIKVIYIPGNHEPVRQAEPQPELQSDYLDILLDANHNIVALPNPSMVKIGSLSILLYHGRSLNAVMKHIPGLQPVNPQTVVEAMSWILRLRNLVPIYGEHPISPEERDWLLIENPPNLFHTGHVHVYGVGDYRGVKLVNSGTFENETPYIRSLGIEVTVGKVPVLNLENLEIKIMDFQ